MRKELIIYLDSSEKEVEFSLRRDAVNSGRILLTFEQMKFSFEPETFRKALEELEGFYNKPGQIVSLKPEEPQNEETKLMTLVPEFE